jgi:hypothetical protein
MCVAACKLPRTHSLAGYRVYKCAPPVVVTNESPARQVFKLSMDIGIRPDLVDEVKMFPAVESATIEAWWMKKLCRLLLTRGSYFVIAQPAKSRLLKTCVINLFEGWNLRRVYTWFRGKQWPRPMMLKGTLPDLKVLSERMNRTMLTNIKHRAKALAKPKRIACTMVYCSHLFGFLSDTYTHRTRLLGERSLGASIPKACLCLQTYTRGAQHYVACIVSNTQPSPKLSNTSCMHAQ